MLIGLIYRRSWTEFQGRNRQHIHIPVSQAQGQAIKSACFYALIIISVISIETGLGTFQGYKFEVIWYSTSIFPFFYPDSLNDYTIFFTRLALLPSLGYVCLFLQYFIIISVISIETVLDTFKGYKFEVINRVLQYSSFSIQNDQAIFLTRLAHRASLAAVYGDIVCLYST